MFYDLSLGFDGVEEHTRREVVSMAMQLGYSGIAANHMLTGVMADSDRCKIKPLELSSVLAAAPGVVEAARFHQDLLGVPAGRPFRQYSRITVVVDDTVQAGALNSANPVLQSYDVVAVRPTNQKAFGQACTHLEVDLISLDFNQRLSFRMKAPMVKAALQLARTYMDDGFERGIFFEISYSRALVDARARRELFVNAQMLQVLTRGRSIILSSGARQAMEVRGPNDVANMASLFGLSLELAKAAVSKNCKNIKNMIRAPLFTNFQNLEVEPRALAMLGSNFWAACTQQIDACVKGFLEDKSLNKLFISRSVLLHGVARKKTYKAAILVELCPPVENLGSDKSLFHVPANWDPLSVGLPKGASADFSKVLEASNEEVAEVGIPSTHMVDRKRKVAEDGNPVSKIVDEKRRDVHTSAGPVPPVDRNFRSIAASGSEWTEVTKRLKRRKPVRAEVGLVGVENDGHNSKI